jgi:nucleotide-binding universal stress UspA family protein
VIVVGSRRLTDWKGLLFGSAAHKVIQHAPCPVIVVR